VTWVNTSRALVDTFHRQDTTEPEFAYAQNPARIKKDAPAERMAYLNMNSGSCKLETKVILSHGPGTVWPICCNHCRIPVAGAASGAESLAGARPRLYQRTDYEGRSESCSSLKIRMPVLQLIGQDYFMTAEYRKATESWRRLRRSLPQRGMLSVARRAYGRRAETRPFRRRICSKARQMSREQCRSIPPTAKP